MHELATSRLTWSFALSFVLFLVFLYRRASVAYLWRSLHLIEDLVLEKEFLAKIDLPLKFLLLALLFTPLITFLPIFLSGFVTKLAFFIIPLLMVHVIVQGFDLIVFGWYFEKHKEANLPAVFRVIVLSIIYIVVILVLLQHVYGINILPVIATSTVMTAVLGLAMQDTLKNLFAGLTISLEKRFRQGDWISFRGDSSVYTTGEISEIGWRTIRIRTLDENYSVIPNATFTNSHITNFSRPKPCFVRTVEFPVVSSASTKQVLDILLESAAGAQGVLSKPTPEAVPVAVKLDQISYRLRFWVDNFEKGDEIAGDVIERCVLRFQNENLIPSKAADLASSALALAIAASPPAVTAGVADEDQDDDDDDDEQVTQTKDSKRAPPVVPTESPVQPAVALKTSKKSSAP